MINTEKLALLMDGYKKAFPSIWNGEIWRRYIDGLLGQLSMDIPV